MSEYTRRVIAFSAIAIILGISISVGIAFLPQAVKSTSETTVATLTTTFLPTTMSFITSIATLTYPQPPTQSPSTVTEAGTTMTSTLASSATVISSMTTAVSSSSVVAFNSTTTSGTMTGTNSAMSCVVSSYPDGIYLQILTDSGISMSGLNVSGEAVFSVNGEQCTDFVHASTNSTGWAYLGNSPGYYYVSFYYNGAKYSLTIPSQPMIESIAAYYIPSGNLTISYCYYDNMMSCSG